MNGIGALKKRIRVVLSPLPPHEKRSKKTAICEPGSRF